MQQRPSRTPVKPINRTTMKSPSRTAAPDRNRRTREQPRTIRPASINSQSGKSAKVTELDKTSTSQPAAKPVSSTPKAPVNRQGQAVASLMFSLLGILSFLYILKHLNEVIKYNSIFSSELKPVMITSFILNIIGFALGIRARHSARGGGIAIVGATFASIPLGICVVILLVFILKLTGVQPL
ncbi:hypothetical protein [Paenibacillus popilliae]|uniref:DUF4190 domain-containing protein n=1 Tax=Paenibacillus popilliae TaxID=78057 RepID=A0ABY3AJ33_PAEPP|nr:hypothetical protein [Paenibacillus sp. SDF0028]TQR41747.1 hypothetical protein C7Y44_24825 [Paenibacillus sp. SDF0028]